MPTTNYTAKVGDTIDSVAAKFCREYSAPIKEIAFKQRNDSAEKLTAGKTYIFGVSPKFPYMPKNKAGIYSSKKVSE